MTLKIITKRDIIKTVTKRWKRQYHHIFAQNPEWKKTLKKLERLNLETVAPETIEKIIGNDSWTTMQCDLCRNKIEKGIHLTDSEYFIVYCETCIDKMKEMLK